MQNYPYKNLVFEGGGVKGIAYGGALTILDERNILKNIERVAGTSAGAITAALISLGYTSVDVSNIISKTDFSSFEDNTFFVFRDIIRLLKNYGWNKGDTFKEWMGKLVAQKTGNENSTFKDLHDDKDGNYKDLYVICSNVTKQRADVLSYETTPNLPVRDAIRMSMGIPIFFTSIKNADGDVIVDGGITLNYPLNIFDNIKYLSNPLNGNAVNYNTEDGYVFNYETLGFRVDSKEEMNYLRPSWNGDPSLTRNLKSFVGALISFMMETVNRRHLHSNDWNRTVFIDSMDVKTTEFKLKTEKINKLIDNGKTSMIDYFNWKDTDIKWKNYPK
jgi:NTE family protein